MTANPLRPARHRPGKPGVAAAAAADSSSEDEDESDVEQEEQQQQPQEASAPTAPPSKPAATSFPKKAALIARGVRDVDIVDGRGGERRVQFEDEESEEEDEEDESGSGSGSSDEESSEEEEESSSSEDEAARRRLLRPVFIKKGARNGAAAVTEPVADVADDTQRKARTDALIQKQLEKKAAARAEEKIFWDDDKVVDDVDDTDGLDPEAEYMAWTIRALKRQKRDEEERLRGEKEREEIERWRSLPEEQRQAEIEERLRKQQEEKDARGKMGFLQKYHHGGAFFQEDMEKAGLAGRDVMGARFEDEVKDRSTLPEFMQIRDQTKLGRKGRTRYKDLRNEDTGSFGNLPDSRRSGKAQYGLDERFRPDDDRDRGGATGANASSLGRRRGDDTSEQRESKRTRID
jgi:microfibrillar-associated protein 1